MLCFVDLNATDTSDFHGPLPVENYIKEIPLPMDRVINELSPQQRLALYEHVLQVRVCVFIIVYSRVSNGLKRVRHDLCILKC